VLKKTKKEVIKISFIKKLETIKWETPGRLNVFSIRKLPAKKVGNMWIK
jgi:hypothetical protein